MDQQTLFIAFTGPQIDQPDAISKIAEGYECWNLNRFDLDNFIGEIQRRIPPVNKNVQLLYRFDAAQPRDPFGIGDEHFAVSSWGLLLPGEVTDVVVDAYPETLFLLNLYSPYFLYPVFFATTKGIIRPDHNKRRELYAHDQNQAARFARPEFVEFFGEMITEAGYGSWNAKRTAGWHKEDWRLFVACHLFSELKAFENSKYPITWQRESADMATILEALFTAGGDENTEIGYRLRKRAAALMGSRLPTVDQDIKKLYGERSSFVHGSFFRKIAKQAKVKDGLAELPLPPFEDLYGQKESVRRTLIAYLYLNKIHRSTEEFDGFDTVMDLLEAAIIDVDLRIKVRHHVDHILALC